MLEIYLAVTWKLCALSTQRRIVRHIGPEPIAEHSDLRLSQAPSVNDMRLCTVGTVDSWECTNALSKCKAECRKSAYAVCKALCSVRRVYSKVSTLRSKIRMCEL